MQPDPNVSNEIGALINIIGLLLIMLSGVTLMFSKRLAGKLILSGFTVIVVGSAVRIMGPDLLNYGLEFIKGLPLWVSVIVGSLLVISLLQAFVALFLGWNAANAFAGTLTASLFKGVFLVLIAPFQLIRRYFNSDDG